MKGGDEQPTCFPCIYLVVVTQLWPATARSKINRGQKECEEECKEHILFRSDLPSYCTHVHTSTHIHHSLSTRSQSQTKGLCVKHFVPIQRMGTAIERHRVNKIHFFVPSSNRPTPWPLRNYTESLSYCWIYYSRFLASHFRHVTPRWTSKTL